MFFRGTPRNIALAIVWTIVAVNFVYFVRRSLMSDYCSVDQLLKKAASSVTSSSSATAAFFTNRVTDDADKISGTAVTGGKKTAEAGTPSASGSTGNEQNEDEFARCETTNESSHGASSSDSRTPKEQRPTWCMYKDEVNLRIIVLTFNRHASLLKLLNSINDLELDGDSVAVEIWIDRDAQTGAVDDKTMSAARSFQWRHGAVGVHVRRRHVGIYGQWIDTWRPRSSTTTEMALILEDDISVSPFAYRWLRAARRFYADRRDDVAGLTLQSESLIVATSGGSFVRPPAADGAAFLYALMGSWGFAPTPSVWMAFQDWFRDVRSKPNYSPVVPGLIMSKWYRNFEKHGKADTMWTMWFLHYCSQVRRSYTVYNNIPPIAKQLLGDGSRSCLAVNRREPGLHFSGKPSNNTNLLLTSWRDEYVRFRDNVTIFGFDGKRLNFAGSSNTRR